MSRDDVERIQFTRLAATLRAVYDNVPFHRDRFDAAGVGPEIGDLADLSRYPTTTKSDVQDNQPFGLTAVPRERLARVHASSGTTGAPTVIGHTRDDLDHWADLMARSMYAAGVRPSHTVHVACTYGLFTGGLGPHYGAERLGATVVPASGGMTARQVRLIDQLRPEVIVATPSYLLTIIDAMRAAGVDPAESSLRVAMLGAEPWTEEMRSEIERTLPVRALNLYGLSEIMGPGVACETADDRPGCVLWEDHFLPEILDPVTGEPTPDGELGELVLTTLTRQATPMIRYRTGDLTRFHTGGGMRRIDRIQGRVDDMVVVHGVNVFPSQIEEQVLRIPGLTPHFVCEVDRGGRLDDMTVLVESAGQQAPEDPGAALQRAVKELVGVTVAVEVVRPGTLPRSEGKAVRLVDRRDSVRATVSHA